jgi:hypothetical protein
MASQLVDAVEENAIHQESRTGRLGSVNHCITIGRRGPISVESALGRGSTFTDRLAAAG